MENERILQLPTLMFVVLLHGLLLWAVWHGQPPKIEMGTSSLSFVDLAALPATGTTAAQTSETRPQPTRKPQVQPHPAPKPQIKPMVTARQHPADLPKPTTTPRIRPTDKPQPAPAAQNPATHTAGKNSSGTTDDNNGNSTSNANSSTAGGGSTVVPREYQGGYLAALRPAYPQLSRENGEEGNVDIAVSVSANGTPTNVRVSKSSGYPRLDRAAKQAVQNYRFKPATRGGMPIPYSYHFTVQFTLKKAP